MRGLGFHFIGSWDFRTWLKFSNMLVISLLDFAFHCGCKFAIDDLVIGFSQKYFLD